MDFVAMLCIVSAGNPRTYLGQLFGSEKVSCITVTGWLGKVAYSQYFRERSFDNLIAAYESALSFQHMVWKCHTNNL